MYLSVKEAAEIMSLTIQAVYQAIRYNTLKSKKLCGKIFTTMAWIEEYKADLCSKQKHSRYNGRPVFEPEKGEYSLKMASEALSIPQHIIKYRIETGKIKAFRRGVYWILTHEEIQRIAQIIKEERKTA